MRKPASGFTVRPDTRCMALPVGKICRKHRNNGKRHEKAYGHGKRYGQPKLPEHLPYHTVHESHREEHRNNDKAYGDNRKLYFAGAADHRFTYFLAAFDMPAYVFDNHDSVINKQADRKAHCHQRYDVYRASCNIQQATCAYQRNWQSHAGYQRRTRIPEEKEYGKYCKQNSQRDG